MVRGKLPAMSRISLGALIVIDVHARDVVDELARNKVDKESDFQWISQLRYYLEVMSSSTLRFSLLRYSDNVLVISII